MKNFLLTAMMGLAVCSAAPKCPIHDKNIGTYDHTEFVDGKTVKVFKCSWGHTFSIVC